MAIARRLKKTFLSLLLAFGVLLWLAALLLFSQIAENSDDFAQAWDWILLINTIGIGILGALILMHIVRLLRDYRRHVPGIRLRTRMVSLLVILVVTPLVVVYVFSVEFINRGIDNWFSLDVEQGLGDALALSQTALDIQKRETIEVLQRVAVSLAQSTELDVVARVSEFREESGASELTLYSATNQILATSSEELNATLPRYPSDDVIFQLQQGDSYVELEPRPDGQYEILAAVNVTATGTQGERRILQAVFPVEQRLASLANAVESSFSQYSELGFLRDALKASFTLTLSLVLLIAVLASVYGAFFSAQRLLVPIQQLMQGTRAVARGDFDTVLPMPNSDEIGFLVNSFNDMTQRLAKARQDASNSQQLVENERKQLEIVLAGLTTGVIALEPDLRIRTANQAASAILGADLSEQVGEPLSELATSQPLLQQFLDVTLGRLSRQELEWREQIVLQGEVGRRVLMCACTALPFEGETPGGVIIVFDDITALLQAQRDAAWGEVARRLAHEIKNPLTPIQLSAERMRRRYITVGSTDLDLLDRATHTIIQQVDALKEMVDAFSQYARTPDIELSQFDLNEIISEVTELYHPQEKWLSIELSLDADLPLVEADAGRIRQVLHNLFRNSIEAMEAAKDGTSAMLKVMTRSIDVDGEAMVQIIVTDNGPGFSTDVVHQAFEPYVTSKLKGTGLGLAIVKKIVDEHGGKISARNLDRGGAEISILLPVSGGSSLLNERSEQRRERA
jgi:nitrogen fixation/metabolism regulation signal transduction histidine kinase